MIEECITLYERIGWQSGLTQKVIEKINELDNQEEVLRRIAKSARSEQDLQQLAIDMT